MANATTETCFLVQSFDKGGSRKDVITFSSEFKGGA